MWNNQFQFNSFWRSRPTLICKVTKAGPVPAFATHGGPVMKLLHIDSGILGTASVSRQLSADAVAAWRARHPGTELVYRDLVAQPLTHLAGDQLFAAATDPDQQSPQ